jgi:ATP-binding cassette subfamily B protein/ATP-binding cassette subfamily C protein
MRIPLKQYWNLLSNYLKPQQGRVIGLAIALLSTIALQLLNPQLLGTFIDTATMGGAMQTLVAIALAFIGVAVLIQLLSVVATYFSEIVAWAATNTLRLDLIEHCLTLDLSHHKSRTPGEWIERVDGDITALSRFFSQLVIHILGNGIFLAGILVMLWFEDWRAGLSLTLFSWLSLVILLRVQTVAIAPWTDYRQKSAEFFGFITEHVAGREDLRANGAVSYVIDRFYRILQDWLPIYHQARFTSTLLWAGSVGLFTLGNAIALALVAYLWTQQAITIGTAYLIFHYTNLLSQPIERIREELEQLQQVEASIHRIRELFQLRSTLLDDGHLSLPSGPLSVRFENVCFWYQKPLDSSVPKAKIQNSKSTIQPTLHSLTFHLPPGHILGLLGHTGSGKTTIARLLLRFYDIQQGEIRIGEQAIAQVPLSELRQHIGLVTQDVQLFQASVRDNLTFFSSAIADDEILHILALLGLSTWLNALPAGLDTVLNSDSGGLSAGQAQLLTFARVFLKNPGLVILDEASSRLDPTTEALIEQAIDTLLHQRTGIIIAHRLKTVQRADQVLILDKGSVVEYGDRLSLMQNPNSRFARLLQLGSSPLSP